MRIALRNAKTQVVPAIVVGIIDLVVWLGISGIHGPLCEVDPLRLNLLLVGGLSSTAVSVVIFIRSLVKKRFKLSIIDGIAVLLSSYVLLSVVFLALGAGICSWQF